MQRPTITVTPFSVLFLGLAASAQVTTRVSVDSLGHQAIGSSSFPSISADGRHVTYLSLAQNLVPGDVNFAADVFVHDRQIGSVVLASLASSGEQANGQCRVPLLSADGRFVAFSSAATNLVPDDTNGFWDVFVRDLWLGTTERVSIRTGGGQGNGDSGASASLGFSISGDGRYVAFESVASNLVAGDSGAWPDVFVHDRSNGTTTRVSADSAGVEGNVGSWGASLSADGRFVSFLSYASSLVPGDVNAVSDVFVRDLQTGAVELANLNFSGAQSDHYSYSATISGDGRYVAFESRAANLDASDTNDVDDIFVRDRHFGLTTRVSVSSSGAQANAESWTPRISQDGRYVLFASVASNLVSDDTNSASADLFVHDRTSGITSRVNVNTSGGQAGNGITSTAGISGDGRYVVFQSTVQNLVFPDTNGNSDVFLHDRVAPGVERLCHPGLSGTISCPCSNPPSGDGRGCDNSSSTGGAQLTAGGGPYCSLDTLSFRTSGEKPSATSIVLQGTSSVASGVVFGQGVRCTGGAVFRLYVKTASFGSITAPDPSVNDPSVSARSAALGDAIQPGESRFYLVYYRDTVVLGGCSTPDTFNATQTAHVQWSP